MKVDFIQEAMEARLNAILEEIRGAGFAIEHAPNEDLRHVSLRRVERLALPGPGAEAPPAASQTARESEGKTSAPGRRGDAKASSNAKSCRFCRRQLRGDNDSGVCSKYACRQELKKESGEKH